MLLFSVGELPFQSRVPWTNDEILVAKENRRKAEKKKRASRTQADLLGISSESQHRVTSDILFNMNNQRLTLFLLLGLSAAFETVAYDTLLNVLFHRLQFSFRIQGKVLSWFKSYFLLGRSEHVIINDIFSDEFSLECGVPQGSHTIYAVYEKAL